MIDVGGGSVDNTTRNSLARIFLRWMIRECFKTNSGIMFDRAGLLGIGLDPARLEPVVVNLPRPPPLSAKFMRIQSIPPCKPSAVALTSPSTEPPLKGHVFPDGKVHVTEPPADMEE
jgi:hypothetical protein